MTIPNKASDKQIALLRDLARRYANRKPRDALTVVLDDHARMSEALGGQGCSTCSVNLHPPTRHCTCAECIEYFSAKPLENQWAPTRPTIYQSNAQWSLDGYGDGISTDSHATREQAGAACAALLTDGLDGEGKHFPLKVWISER